MRRYNLVCLLSASVVCLIVAGIWTRNSHDKDKVVPPNQRSESAAQGQTFLIDSTDPAEIVRLAAPQLMQAGPITRSLLSTDFCSKTNCNALKFSFQLDLDGDNSDEWILFGQYPTSDNADGSISITFSDGRNRNIFILILSKAPKGWRKRIIMPWKSGFASGETLTEARNELLRLKHLGLAVSVEDLPDENARGLLIFGCVECDDPGVLLKWNGSDFEMVQRVPSE